MDDIIFYDFEVFKHDWMICWLDTKTRKTHFIINDKVKFEQMYAHYKDQVWVGYNSRAYDVWIAKAILCDFNPYEMSDWLINQDRKGFEFSRTLNKFPIMNYDCSYFFSSLKQLEAFMGHDIRETSVPFDIDRALTNDELRSTLEYCKHDVMETFEVFLETTADYESHIGLMKDFELPLQMVSKTKAQISAVILDANPVKRNDEFDIRFPEPLDLGKYEWIRKWYQEWADTNQKYEEMKLSTEIAGVPHKFGIGGLHGSVDNYFGEGYYLMADVASYYPAMMIEYDFLSRNVLSPKKYKEIRDMRIVLKKAGDPKQLSMKIVLNATFGASKDKYNRLYDPLQANNICIAGQLLLVDLIDKLEGKCQLIQSNTDGILVKLFRKEDKEEIIRICEVWSKRTRMDLDYDMYRKVIQKDVNNYIIVDEDGDIKRKGAFVKKLKYIDNDLPIVNRAVVDYFTKNVPVKKTVMASNDMIDFQKITKVTGKYEYASHNGVILHERVYRCFASQLSSDGTLYKKHKKKDSLDKTPSTPVNCFVDNSNIIGKKVSQRLDRKWYIQLAEERIAKFLGKKVVSGN